MPMREDCLHYESRAYEGGEVARFCTKDLAPEAPWRCPDPCAGYERILLIGSDFEAGSLAVPPVGDAPDAEPQDIADVLDDAEDIVNAAAPDILADLDRKEAKKGPWWRRRRRGDDGGDFRLSNR
jgi:hypothetical protein